MTACKKTKKRPLYRLLIFPVLPVLIFFIFSPRLCAVKDVKVGIYDFDPLCRTINPVKDGGLFPEILKHIASKEEWNIEYVVGTLAEGMSRLRTGEIDLLAAATHSVKSETHIDFTNETVISTWAQVYALNQSRIQSLIDLNGRSIGLVRDDPYNKSLRDIVNRFNIEARFLEFKNSRHVFQAIKDRWIDAGVVDRLYGVLHTVVVGVKQTPVVFSPVELRFAAAKGKNQSLIDVLDYHLNLLKKDRDSIYYRLVNQALGEEKAFLIPGFLIWILAAVFGLLILFVGTSVILRRQVDMKTGELNQKNRTLMQEIRNREQAEEALRESEEKFRLISEQALMAVAIIQDDVIKYANKAFARLSEYTLDEILNWQPGEYAELLHADDRPFVMEQSRRKQEGNPDVSNHYSYRLFTKSGKRRWAEHYSKSILFKGRYASLMTVVDITEAKEAEEKLATEKERLAVTLRSIGDGVITTDHKGKIVLMNPIAEAMTGWKQSDAAGCPITDIFRVIDGRTRHDCENPVLKVLKSRTMIEYANDYFLCSRDGTEYIILDSCAPIRFNDDQMMGTILVFHDITEKRRMELEIQKALKLEALSLLSAGIAHDFTNLLTVILGNIDLAKNSLNPRDITYKLLEKAEKGALNASGLSRQLLTFAKGNAPVKEAASIKEIIEDSVHFSMSGSATRCECTFDPDLFPVDVDKGQISQVFQNLIINADQAMPCGGYITVCVQNVPDGSKALPTLQPTSYIKISIRDQGVGISDQYIDKIFDPFFTTKQKGNGLGLAMVYSIIRKHDGQITVESEAGKGTTFFIYLPASKNKIVHPAEHKRIHYKGKGKILVMDDNESIRDMVGEILERLGYNFDVASDGEEAVHMYRRSFHSPNPFDAVIMDLTIPGGMGGKEAIGKLREFDPNIAAIVVSGYANDPVLANFKGYGFKGVIGKPFHMDKLALTLYNVIQKNRKPAAILGSE